MARSQLPSLRGAQTAIARMDFSPGVIEQAKRKLVELMNAQQIVRSTKRAANGGIAYERVPCVTVQLAAAVKVLEFGIGTPSPMVSVKEPEDVRPAKAELAELLADQPALVGAILSIMKDAVEHRKPIEVQPVAPAQLPEGEKK